WLTPAEYEARRAERSWIALAPSHASRPSAAGHRCELCGYGVAQSKPPARCPMCGIASWLPERPAAIAFG
ncbi:MAG TPA: hypothetical protein VLN26_07410, partial [Gaiellaceae bacterium]|nr:hypothetical protein [Gaiellaceae bacterium]